MSDPAEFLRSTTEFAARLLDYFLAETISPVSIACRIEEAERALHVLTVH
jgi:hypothetical protein